jgi:hypothetical protein
VDAERKTEHGRLLVIAEAGMLPGIGQGDVRHPIAVVGCRRRTATHLGLDAGS